MYITIDSVKTAKKVDYNKNENWVKFHIGEGNAESCTIIIDDWGSRFDNTTGRSKYIYVNLDNEEKDFVNDANDFGYTDGRGYAIKYYWGNPLPIALYDCHPYIPDPNYEYYGGYFTYDSSNETWSFEWTESEVS